MAETFTPEDQIRPEREPAGPSVSNSFADMPESDRMEIGPPAGSEGKIQDVVRAAAQAELDLQPAADEPAAVPASTPASTVSQEVHQALRQYDLQKQQEHAQYVANQQRLAQVQREFVPPTFGDAEEALSDAGKYGQDRAAIVDYARRTAIAAAAPLAQMVDDQGAKMNAVLGFAHGQAWNQARTILAADGIDADAQYGDVERVLASNPQTYHQYRMDPNALIKAARLVSDYKQGSAFSGPVEQAPRPASTGTGRQANRAGAGRGPALAATERAGLASAQRVLGRQLRPETLQRYQESR